MGILLNVCDDLSPELFKPLFTHIEVLFSLKMFPLVKTFSQHMIILTYLGRRREVCVTFRCHIYAVNVLRAS